MIVSLFILRGINLSMCSGLTQSWFCSASGRVLRRHNHRLGESFYRFIYGSQCGRFSEDLGTCSIARYNFVSPYFSIRHNFVSPYFSISHPDRRASKSGKYSKSRMICECEQRFYLNPEHRFWGIQV